jgi:hypothetical protein
MRKLAVALFLVMLLAGAAYGSGNRKTIKEYYPRDRVVEREVIRERPVYIEKKPSHHKWWQWRKSDRNDERGRDHDH